MILIGLNKPEYNLTNQDIAKSQPNYIKFQTTRLPSNPLNPVYKISEVEHRPATPPKFLRDQITNDDIDGAHPKQAKYYQTRDILQVNDIDGAKAKKVYVRQTEYDSFAYADITKTKFTTTRSVNPLKPNYTMRDDTGALITIGDIAGSSPKKQPERKVGTFFDGLQTGDIAGAKSSSKGRGAFHSIERKHFRDTNNIQDIPGAKVNTLKKGVSTQRFTNPLNPQYVMPGATEAGQSEPFGPGDGSSMNNKYIQIKKALEAKEEAAKQKTLKETVKNEVAFKLDMAKFYGVNPAATKDIPLDHFIG